MVPQGSILGSLLFNIFLWYLFLIMDNIDILTLTYTRGNSFEEVSEKLENVSKKRTLRERFKWFSDNQMKVNPHKFNFLCSSNSEVSLTIENKKIQNIKCEKFLGIKLDSKLNFSFHIHDICQKAVQKLNAMSRITPYINFAKRRLLVYTIFSSQFNCYQHVWMCRN